MKLPVPLPCINLRAPLGQSLQCQTCTGKVNVPLMGCSVFGSCTQTKVVKDADGRPVPCCLICTKRSNAKLIPLPSAALLACGSDKVPLHRYGEMYDALFAGKPIKSILEIGVLKGDSLAGWRAAFPDAKILGADCDASVYVYTRGNAEFVLLDAHDPEQLRAFAAKHQGEFDLIVDDASHQPFAQRLVVEHLRQCIAPGGVMVVEDIADGEVARDLADIGGRVWDNRFETGNAHSRAVSIPPLPTPTAVPVGVVIGSFGWPECVDLQCKLIRQTCGPVPICVSNDKPEIREQIEAICRSHSDVWQWPSVERIGHTGGDVSAYFKAAIWGASRGLQFVAKLSQRFLIETPNWLQNGAAELAATKAAIAIQECSSRDRRLPLRTEAAIIAVQQWNRPSLLTRIMPQRYWEESPNGLTAEKIMYRAIEDFWGGTFHPWSLIGNERKKKSPGVIWHDSHARADYDAIAKRFGVVLPSDFHTDGWGEALKNGTYNYG